MGHRRPDERQRLEPYLQAGVYDILPLPIDVSAAHVALRRLVASRQLMARNEFYRALIGVAAAVLPVWFTLSYFLSRAY